MSKQPSDAAMKVARMFVDNPVGFTTDELASVLDAFAAERVKAEREHIASALEVVDKDSLKAIATAIRRRGAR